jgi:hypothetical protein
MSALVAHRNNRARYWAYRRHPPGRPYRVGVATIQEAGEQAYVRAG